MQQQVSNIEQSLGVATTDALVNKDFKTFVKLAYLHNVIDDPLDIEDSDELIYEVIDQNINFRDTITADSYKMKYLYETDSVIVLKAEAYPDRFNHYYFRFIVSKKTGLMELGLWSETEPSKPWETTLVDEKNGVLTIKTQFWTMRMQEIQTLKVYETHFSAAGYRISRCDGATLLNFPIYGVTPN